MLHEEELRKGAGLVATRYVLSTDASKRGERASIGVVLRQKTTARGSEVVAYISHEINPVSIAAAEYRAAVRRAQVGRVLQA
jgi:hypothetical protein